MKPIQLVFAGDIYALHRRWGVDSTISKLVHTAAIVSCNLEAPLVADRSRPAEKAGPVIGQPIAIASHLKKIGFNLFSLANNHIFDYGKEGILTTLKYLKGSIVVGAGLSSQQAYELKIIRVSDADIGFLSFCEAEFGYLTQENYHKSGFAWIHDPNTLNLISESKKKVDLLFVQIHAGAEKTNIPLPEWRSCYRQVCEAGADAVIGHHPHVAQGWERYKGKYILYSLGNFFFELDPLRTNGLLAQFSIRNKKITMLKVLPLQWKDSAVSVDMPSKEKLNNLCKILKKGYIEKADALALERWQNNYLPYYGYSLKSMITATFMQKLVFHFRSILLGNNCNQIDNVLLLHNIRIETHRWLSIRALEQICTKERI